MLRLCVLHILINSLDYAFCYIKRINDQVVEERLLPAHPNADCLYKLSNIIVNKNMDLVTGLSIQTHNLRVKGQGHLI